MPRRFVLRTSIALTLCAVLLLTACGGGGDTSTTISSITVSPATVTVVAGKTQQLTATAKYSDGSTKPVTNVTWASSNPALATIDANGLLTGKAQGSVTASASVGAVKGTSQVTVSAPELVSIAVTPAPLSLPLGRAQQLTANGSYSDGSTKAVTATWTSSDEAVATVSATGSVTTLTEGTATITASVSTHTATSALTVTAPVVDTIAVAPDTNSLTLGSTVQFQATATYSNTTTQDVTASATWATAGSGVVTVLNTAGRNGFALGAGAGVETVTATFDGVTGSAALEVKAPKARFAYVGNDSAPAISTFSIQDGYLRATGFTRAIADVWWVSTDRSGQFLLAATDGQADGADVVTTFGIDPKTGALTDLGSVSGGAAWQLAFHPTNRLVYLAADNGLFAYTFAPENGSLAPAGVYMAGETARAIVIEPAGRFLYILGVHLVNAYSIDATTGALTFVEGYSLDAGGESLALDPLGRFLYVGGYTKVFGFAINPADGKLTAIDGMAECTDCAYITADKSGKTLYVASFYEDQNLDYWSNLRRFAIDPATGVLSEVGEGLPTNGYNFVPFLSPDATMLYAVDNWSSGLRGYPADPDGTLASGITSARALHNPSSIAFSTTEEAESYTPRYAVMSMFDGYNTAVNFLFTVDSQTGGLSTLSSMSFDLNPARAAAVKQAVSAARQPKSPRTPLLQSRPARETQSRVPAPRTKKAVN